MSETARIVVAGASGRMGQMLIKAVIDSPRCELVGALDHAGSEAIGKDAGRIAGRDPLGVAITSDLHESFAKADALIDFTVPEATLAHAKIAAQARIVHVIGTTGFTTEQLEKLAAAARHATIIRAGNMSLGVNLLMGLVAQAAKALGADYDIEVIEAHHKHKVDAPSGTALMLGEAAAEGQGTRLEDRRAQPRDGITGERPEGEIGFSVVRGGDIVGEHEVLFVGEGERIGLSHIATDRALFARGALRAALWGIGKPPGAYDMRDVLGLDGEARV